jgi:tetratricopeptide (TPR) repeat protein
MMRWKLMTVSAVVLAVGCGGSATTEPKVPANPSDKKSGAGVVVSKEAEAKYDAALDGFISFDKEQKWTAAGCDEVAGKFLSAAKEQEGATNRAFPEAIYNAGLAYQRCGDDDKARSQFQSAADADKGFHRARAQLALYDYKKSGNLDGAIQALDQVIRDAKFQNVEALVALAALQMERGNDQPNPDGKNDLERAKLNLQRALAIDDSYMPAFNQLAIYYLEAAKASASKETGSRRGRRRGLMVASAKKVDVNAQQLDLAALVASQAIQKNPFYAPIHNTAGLIQVELKNFNTAVKSFAKARALDPTFFEAHMNYAAVNLSFRGFKEAETSYREALKLNPKEYEAQLGLALAIRGQIMPGGEMDKLIADAQSHLDEAKKLEPSRAETFYNEAILTQEYRTKTASEDDAIKNYLLAASQLDDFVKKAGSDAMFADAVKRSKERAQDARDTAEFIKGTIESRRQQAEIDKKMKEEAAKNPPPPPPPAEGEAPPPAADGAAPAPAPAPAPKP